MKIYIKDPPLALHKCNLKKYADDTSISYAYKNIEEPNPTRSRDLECLSKRLQSIKKLNVVKTRAMVIAFQLVSFGGSIINLVSNVNYLGVQLDTNVDCNDILQNTSCFKFPRLP